MENTLYNAHVRLSREHVNLKCHIHVYTTIDQVSECAINNYE